MSRSISDATCIKRLTTIFGQSLCVGAAQPVSHPLSRVTYPRTVPKEISAVARSFLHSFSAESWQKCLLLPHNMMWLCQIWRMWKGQAAVALRTKSQLAGCVGHCLQLRQALLTESGQRHSLLDVTATECEIAQLLGFPEPASLSRKAGLCSGAA